MKEMIIFQFRLIYMLITLLVMLSSVAKCQSIQNEGLKYHYFDSERVQIAYLEKGQGEPVILLHAAMADSKFNWVQFGIMDSLAKNYRVIAMDLRGHGKSGKPYYPNAYGRLMVGDVIALLDHLKIFGAHLLGYSMGSHIAMAVMADYPDRIISASFGGPTWIKTGGGNIEPLPSREFFSKMNDEVFGGSNDMDAIMFCLGSQADWAVTKKALEKAHVPCLFIFGTKDENGKYIPDLKRELGTCASFTDIEGAGHGDVLIYPAFLQTVLQYLSDHSGSMLH